MSFDEDMPEMDVSDGSRSRDLPLTHRVKPLKGIIQYRNIILDGYCNTPEEYCIPTGKWSSTFWITKSRYDSMSSEFGELNSTPSIEWREIVLKNDPKSKKKTLTQRMNDAEERIISLEGIIEKLIVAIKTNEIELTNINETVIVDDVEYVVTRSGYYVGT